MGIVPIQKANRSWELHQHTRWGKFASIARGAASTGLSPWKRSGAISRCRYAILRACPASGSQALPSEARVIKTA